MQYVCCAYGKVCIHSHGKESLLTEMRSPFQTNLFSMQPFVGTHIFHAALLGSHIAFLQTGEGFS